MRLLRVQPLWRSTTRGPRARDRRLELGGPHPAARKLRVGSASRGWGSRGMLHVGCGDGRLTRAAAAAQEDAATAKMRQRERARELDRERESERGGRGQTASRTSNRRKPRCSRHSSSTCTQENTNAPLSASAPNIPTPHAPYSNSTPEIPRPASRSER